MAQISIGSNLYVPAEKFGFRPQFGDGLRGFLHKQGHAVKNWKLRYFVLDPSSSALRYYTDETTQQLQGEWKLSRTSTVQGKEDPMDDRDHIIELNASRLSGEKDKLYLSARSVEDKKKWIHAINEAICEGNIEVTQPDLWDRFSVDFYMKITLQDSSPEPQFLTVDDGLIVDVSHGPNIPQVSFPSKGLSRSPFYAVAVLDMDYPSRDSLDRRLYLMQLRVNLSDTNVLGHELLDYQVPIYVDDTLHRIFFVAFAQQGFIAPNSARLTERDFFQPREFAKKFGMTRPVAIEGCYFARKSSSSIPDSNLSQTTDDISSVGGDALGSYNSPAQRRHKKFKYYSQHAKRASLTLDNVSNHLQSSSLNGNGVKSPNSSVSTPSGVTTPHNITQLSDEAELDHYLALPVPPDAPISRDTSTASTTTASSHRRVSFLSSTASLTISSNKPLVSVLKRPGSKRLNQKKTVSFVSNEIQYVATDIPLDVEMDVYAADDDAPDYDTGSSYGKVATRSNTNASSSEVGAYKDMPPPYKHTPKSISANTNRMVADSFSDDNSANVLASSEGKRSFVTGGTANERSSSFHLGTNQQRLNGTSSVYSDGATVPSEYIINTSEESSEIESFRELPSSTIGDTIELRLSFKELLAMKVSDARSACHFFRVSDKHIFIGEIFMKKFSSDYTFKKSYVWIHVPTMRIYWAKSQADKDIVGRNKFLSLEQSSDCSITDSSGSKGSVQSVTQPDKSTLTLATRDGQTLIIKSTSAERIEEWFVVLSSLLTQTQPS